MEFLVSMGPLQRKFHPSYIYVLEIFSTYVKMSVPVRSITFFPPVHRLFFTKVVQRVSWCERKFHHKEPIKTPSQRLIHSGMCCFSLTNFRHKSKQRCDVMCCVTLVFLLFVPLDPDLPLEEQHGGKILCLSQMNVSKCCSISNTKDMVHLNNK